MSMQSELLESIIENRLVIDFPKLSLTPCSPDSTNKIHEGSGSIQQNSDGSISMKAYCTDNVSHKEVFQSLNSPAGKIIEEKRFYNLVATDIYGREWISNQIIPYIHAGHEIPGYIINGKIGQISCLEDLGLEKDVHSAIVYFPGMINFPSNTTTKWEKTVSGERRISSVDLNIASFKSCDIDFEIEKQSQWMEFSAVSRTLNIDDVAVMRFIEALQFVLARILEWSVSEIVNGTMRKITIKACQTNIQNANHRPPILPRRVDHNNHHWILFDRYLRKVINYKEDLWHPIFYWIHAVIESSVTSVDT